VRLTNALASFCLSTSLSETLGFGGVVVAITYLSLIIGALVPKQKALRAPAPPFPRTATVKLWPGFDWKVWVLCQGSARISTSPAGGQSRRFRRSPN
jgi:CBS domain containing-hemolysin-like protein